MIMSIKMAYNTDASYKGNWFGNFFNKKVLVNNLNKNFFCKSSENLLKINNNKENTLLMFL